MAYARCCKRLIAAAAALGGVVLLAACGNSSDAGSSAKAQGKADTTAAQKASKAQITLAQKDGSSSIGITPDSSRVTVSDGELLRVTLTSEKGTVIEGSFSPDKTVWQPARQLEQSVKYKITAEAKDSEGRKAVANSSFTTVSPAHSFIGSFAPEEGSIVGVGMPVSISFDKPVKNRRDVQSRITVNSSSGQQAVGHWFGDQRIDFRPQDYWKTGSEVTLKLNLDGIEGAPGIKGVQKKSVSFTIGHAQVSTVDAKTHQMTVMRDGKLLKVIPVSAGSARTPTYNGKMVISEKLKETRMDGSTVGFTKPDGKGEYDILDVPHAMRLSASGTFIHGNFWGNGVFGTANTSHGCIGLQDKRGADDPSTAGAWFYNNSQIGDIVEVKNSDDRTIAPDNGFNGWNMDWNTWTAGSS